MRHLNQKRHSYAIPNSPFSTIMRKAFNTTTTFTAILLASFYQLGAAHSHLADPLPTRQLHCRVGGDARECHGPCPIPDDYGRLNPVNRNQPAEVWARGDIVNIRWHRDNHDGTGFVRLSLVPIENLLDKKAHERFAFQFLCMNEGPHSCSDRSYNTCGNDFEGMAWQARVKVPTSYPDGVYVFGWSWYGGGNYLDRSFFGDYYSCSYVEIRGGVPITGEYKPVWDGKPCRSGADRLGVCWREPCHIGPMRDMIPFEFNGREPEPIRSSWLAESGGSGSSVVLASGSGASGSAGSGGSFVSVGSGAGSAVSSAGGSGSSVSLGARTTGENRDIPVSRSGALGVFFLDFQDWSKKEIRHNGFYRTANFPRGFTVEAFYDGPVKYFEFFIDGEFVRRERTPPYVMNGNRGQLINGWSVPVGRPVKVRVEVTARGRESEAFEATFQFD